MSVDLVSAAQANLFSVPILFFCLGVVASLVKSDLRFPESLYVGITIYLLAAIGLKGGAAMSESGLSTVVVGMLAAIGLGAAIPLWCYPLLRWLGRLRPVDAAAIAAHYGSASAVTFITAVNFLTELKQPFETYSAAFLAVMESPAIIIGILLGKMKAPAGDRVLVASFPHALREAILGRSVFVLIGALVIGLLAGQRGLEATSGFFVTPFQGALSLFLLEMGMVAARRVNELRRVGLFLLAFGVVMPVLHGMAGVLLGSMVGLSLGGATLLGVLAASASYIAAPAAMRLSLPEANPGLYLTSSLVITFPFNITVGVPIYYSFARWWFQV